MYLPSRIHWRCPSRMLPQWVFYYSVQNLDSSFLKDQICRFEFLIFTKLEIISSKNWFKWQISHEIGQNKTMGIFASQKFSKIETFEPSNFVRIGKLIILKGMFKIWSSVPCPAQCGNQRFCEINFLTYKSIDFTNFFHLRVNFSIFHTVPPLHTPFNSLHCACLQFPLPPSTLWWAAVAILNARNTQLAWMAHAGILAHMMILVPPTHFAKWFSTVQNVLAQLGI